MVVVNVFWLERVVMLWKLVVQRWLVEQLCRLECEMRMLRWMVVVVEALVLVSRLLVGQCGDVIPAALNNALVQ